ncbi:MAG: CPBP family intramembrane glutamic endopeptidase [Ilumatobacter fluminis]|uniref:CPBP family intramembrane glutamic endopeptidase n=1 Tax=Ilumatobacter fluminis TaxID=467091 RepID=UPI0032F03E9E
MRVPLRVAGFAWVTGWIVGGLLLAWLALAAMGVDLSGDQDLTIPQLSVSAVAQWTAFGAVLFVVSRQFGTGEPLVDYAVAFRPIDLLAVPAGVIAQVAALPVLYWPLQQLWPDTFSQEALEERARDLADSASGGAVVLLVLVVAIGAPIFEELVYRGLLQRSLVDTIGRWPGLVAASLWFAAIHLAPVELPGLFMAGMVFGGAMHLTGRLGPAMLAHFGFNAAGLAIAFS